MPGASAVSTASTNFTGALLGLLADGVEGCDTADSDGTSATRMSAVDGVLTRGVLDLRWLAWLSLFRLLVAVSLLRVSLAVCDCVSGTVRWTLLRLSSSFSPSSHSSSF